MDASHEGGCMCGALRYRAGGRPADAGYCHCRMCQRSTGAPVMAWASFSSRQFDYTRGAPRVYPSSERGRREFCETCGTQILFREEGAGTVDLNLGSLDDPAAIAPRHHSWTMSRIPWFEIADELPDYRDAGPERR